MKPHLKLHLFILLIFSTTMELLGQKILRIENQAGCSFSTFNAPFPKEYLSPNVKNGINPSFGVVVYYHLNKLYGLYSGIQIDFSQFNFSVDSISESFNSIDSEHMPYIRNVYGSSIKEKSSIILLNIPLRFFYNFPITRNIIITSTFGPGLSIPLKKNSNGEGIFTYTGLYPELDNVILKDIIPYGFSSDVKVNEKQTLKSNFLILNAGASLGVSFSISRRTKFQTTVSYQRSLTALIPKEKRTGYHISNDLGSFHSLMSINKGFIQGFYISAGLQKIIMF